MTRSRTIPAKRLTRAVIAAGAVEYPDDIERPVTREDCRGAVRPCPWVSCRYHLYLDINAQTGSLKLNFPDLEPGDLAASCALDEAERGGMALEEVAQRLNLTRERIRQVEVRGLLLLKRSAGRLGR